jgi:hypothetical protein
MQTSRSARQGGSSQGAPLQHDPSRPVVHDLDARYVGIEVSQCQTSARVVDASGKVAFEGRRRWDASAPVLEVEDCTAGPIGRNFEALLHLMLARVELDADLNAVQASAAVKGTLLTQMT